MRRQKKAKPDKRHKDMRAMYLAGRTLADIGLKYGISRERVRQLLTKLYGISGADGGQVVRSRKRRDKISKNRESRSLVKRGCSYKDYRSVVDHPDRPTFAFQSQRRTARSRGIQWDLTLWQWWKIWERSGHWANRGRGHGYQMCRSNDIGPYAVDNVYIATGVENMQDHWVNRRASALEKPMLSGT